MHLPRQLVACVFIVLVAACGAQSPAPPAAIVGEEAPPESTLADHDLGVNSQIHLTQEIEAAWRGARLKVTDTAAGTSEEYVVEVGATLELGATGITVRAGAFIPDFSMDEDGITSTTAEPVNPALEVVITDESDDVFDGWLFAAMPEIHAYSHPVYSVVLVEGVPR